jgi:hypothetical protein
LAQPVEAALDVRGVRQSPGLTVIPALEPPSDPAASPALDRVFNPAFSPILKAVFDTVFSPIPVPTPTPGPVFDLALEPPSDPAAGPALDAVFNPAFGPVPTPVSGPVFGAARSASLNSVFHPAFDPVFSAYSTPAPSAPPAGRGSARQPADGGSVGARPQAETAAGFDRITKPLAQAVVLREALREETINRVGRDPGGKRVERKIARSTRGESPQPAEQFQHGFARQLGRVRGSVEGTQPSPDHAIQNGRGAIGEQGFEDAIGVFTGCRSG